MNIFKINFFTSKSIFECFVSKEICSSFLKLVKLRCNLCHLGIVSSLLCICIKCTNAKVSFSSKVNKFCECLCSYFCIVSTIVPVFVFDTEELSDCAKTFSSWSTWSIFKDCSSHAHCVSHASRIPLKSEFCSLALHNFIVELCVLCNSKWVCASPF